MKISLNWLRQYIDLPESPEKIANLLTQSGLEVSNIAMFDSVQDSLQGLLIGQITTCKKHPNDDKLQLTTIDINSGKPLAIICEAPNVQAGQKVIVAPVGTAIYSYTGGEHKISETMIRGVMSEGMILAEDEIGLGPSHEEILVLDTPLPPGTPAKEYFNIQPDPIFTIDLTPNRVDACSHIGIARELGAMLDRPVQLPTIAQWQLEAPILPIQVAIANPKLCPRYTGIVMRGITVQRSPYWLQNKLKAIGIKPTNNIIDITNFIAHELGQPIHVVDYDQIVGQQIHINTSKQSRSLTTIDGVRRELLKEELMISDQAGGIAIAGILGSRRTRIHQNTQNIFLESAYFSPEIIRKTTQQQGIKTDAAWRYERGTDPNMTVYALQRAVGLIQAITQGKAASQIIDIYPQVIQHRAISVDYKNIQNIIGQYIPHASIKKILSNLNITVSDEQVDSFIALVPPYRLDITREIDVIEAILKIYGYENIKVKTHLGTTFLAETPQLMPYQLAHEVATLLAAHGYHEMYTNSLISSTYAKLIPALDQVHSIHLLNPLSERLDMLRTTLIFSGLEVIVHHINSKQPDLRLFELGKIYQKHDNSYLEQNRLGIWITGNQEAQNWISKPRAATFQDLNAILHKVLQRLGLVGIHSEPIKNSCYQTSVQLTCHQKILATMGSLNPTLLQHMGIKQTVFFADIDWDKLLNQPRRHIRYQAIPKWPIVKRDLSLVLDLGITFSEIKKLVRQQDEPLIRDMLLFDVYQGASLPASKKAYALSLMLQSEDKTLDDQRIHQVMKRLIRSFKDQLGAIIRE